MLQTAAKMQCQSNWTRRLTASDWSPNQDLVWKMLFPFVHVCASEMAPPWKQGMKKLAGDSGTRKKNKDALDKEREAAVKGAAVLDVIGFFSAGPW